MANNTAETLIGAIVLTVAGGFIVYAATTADLSIGESDGYEVVANFRKAEGINIGGDVRIAGVKVGTITRMELDPRTYDAALTLSIEGAVELPEDTSAKITSASLLGDSFIALEIGASDFMLEPGDQIEHTQGSVNLLDLALRFGLGSESGSAE